MAKLTSRETIDDIERVQQRLHELEVKRVRSIGELVIRIMGSRTTMNEVVGALKIARDRTNAAEREAVGAEWFRGRTAGGTKSNAKRAGGDAAEQSNGAAHSGVGSGRSSSEAKRKDASELSDDRARSEWTMANYPKANQT